MRLALRPLLPLVVAGAIATGLAAGCNGGSGHSLLPGPSVTAVPGDAEIVVSWTPVDGATDYYVYWAEDPTLTSDNVFDVGGTRDTNPGPPPYTIGGLTNGPT